MSSAASQASVCANERIRLPAEFAGQFRSGDRVSVTATSEGVFIEPWPVPGAIDEFATPPDDVIMLLPDLELRVPLETFADAGTSTGEFLALLPVSDGLLFVPIRDGRAPEDWWIRAAKSGPKSEEEFSAFLLASSVKTPEEIEAVAHP